MEEEKKTTKKKRSVAARIGRGIAIFILSLIALVVLILVLIQTAPVQNFARKKIVTFLEKKLDTRVDIARLDIDFPKMLVLEGVYIEDQKKDTLIAGKQLKVDIDMFKLIKGEIQINEINLNTITAKVKRELPDTIFNFQFIVDAFATAPSTTTKDTSALKMAIEKIIVDKTRMVYKDVVTGNDVDVFINHFDTHISKFDLNNIAFDVPDITLQGLRGVIRQTKPIAITAVVANPDSTKTGEKPAFLKFSNKETKFSDIDVDYSNEVSNLATRIKIGSLNLFPKEINLETSTITIDEIALNKLEGNVAIGKGTGQDAIKLTNENEQEIVEPMPWKVRVNKLTLDNNAFVFDDNTKPKLPRGMDFAHLNMSNLTFHLQDFYFHNDTISGQVTKGTLVDKSGFDLRALEATFAYTDKGVSLKDFLIQTPGTELKRSAVIRYPSLLAIQKNPGLMEMDIELVDSKIKVRDVLLLVPQLAAQPAFNNPNETMYVDSRITGSVSRLNINRFKFRGFGNTVLDVSGRVYGLPNPNQVSADLSIRTFKTTRADVLSLVPAGTIPPNITLPQSMALSGTIKGNAQQANANIDLVTSLGSAKLNGTIANATNMDAARYNGTLAVNKLNAGAIIENPEMVGMITGNISFKGVGFNPEKANAVVKGTIRSAEIKKYTYNNLNFDAAIAKQRVTAKTNIKDANIDLNLQAVAYMGGELPGFNIVAEIDSIKTQPLHLTPNAIIYKGKIVADFPTLNLDALSGEAYVTNSVLVVDGQRVAMDSIALLASYNNNTQVIVLNTPFMHADITGKYKLQQIGDIMIGTIQPYFAINTTGKPVYTDPYDFTVNAFVIDHPTLRAFVPTLTRFDSVRLAAEFVTGGGMNATLNAPAIVMGTNTIDGLNLTANTTDNSLNIMTNVNRVKSGASIALYQTSLGASLANNQVDFTLRIKDKTAKEKYTLSGLLAQADNNNYSLRLKPDSLMLNYDQWNVAPDNLIQFGKLITASNFALSRNNQRLIINSTTQQANSPMEVRFENFQIATLTAFVQSDSLMAAGTINGNVMLKDLQTTPNFNTDLTISNLAINQDTLGTLNAKINNNTADVFNTNVTLTGNGNDLAVTGKYYMKPADGNNLDLVLNINRISLATLEGASMGMIADASGYLSGKVDINGPTAAPKVLGGISFNQSEFTVTMINSPFKIDNETITVDAEGIKLNTFTIRDSANNRLVIDGAAYTTNFTNYRYALTIRARDFRAINSTKLDNPLYYGQLYFNSSLNIKGTEVAPVIDGSLSVNDKTNLSIVIPQPEPGIVDRKGIIEFVDMDAPNDDSLFIAATKAIYDSSFNKSQVRGFDISANIEIAKEAIFNIIVDEANGDFLNMRGEGLLNGGIDPSGKITLTGTYTIEEGGYNLSFNFLKRQFTMQKGGKITWTGEPTTGNLDVTAIYVANTSAMDLVGDQVATASKSLYMQKLPFEVHLNVTGELMTPNLAFDIVLPTDKNLRVSGEVLSTVTTRLDQLKSEPSELNKQVFALLLLNRFISENPFKNSGGGGGFNAEGFARQSVSRLLTEQLNKLAADLVGGVELSFDVNSSEEYTTGTMTNRTDLNVNLSKRLLNDRLKVSVGSNFELDAAQQPPPKGGAAATSGIIGNLTVDYSLTKDGAFLLRGYRKNDYEAILEGFVVENGLKFIITVDYDQFKEIFQRRKIRRELKKQMKEAEDTTYKITNTTSITTPEPREKKDVVDNEIRSSADNRKQTLAVTKEDDNEY